MSKKALILGIGGQDGCYLSSLLHEKGYEVWGVARPEDLGDETLDMLKGKAGLIHGDIRDGVLLARAFSEIRPGEIYNLAGISFIPLSWERPALVGEINGSAVGSILELIRTNLPEARFFQAGSSEMFGRSPVESPQDENTPFKPDNPYASAKVFAAHLVANYRKQFNLFACNGILYNHESPIRGEQFVTRKITRAAAEIRLGRRNELVLGDLDACRDWSYAGDTVRGMWMMLQKERAEDFVLGSGKLHSIRDCLDAAFSGVELDWRKFVRTDAKLVRPVETKPLVARPEKATRALGWVPEVDFDGLIRMMVKADLSLLSSGSF